MKLLVAAVLSLTLFSCQYIAGGESDLHFRLLVASYIDDDPVRAQGVYEAAQRIRETAQDNPLMTVAALRTEAERSIPWGEISAVRRELVIELLDYMENRARSIEGMPESVYLAQLIHAIERQAQRSLDYAKT